MKKIAIATCFLASIQPAFAANREPTVISCKFEKLPLVMLMIRGGMGATDNTVQIGQAKPIKLSVGSSLMLAETGAQSFTFSLRLPANVSVSSRGGDSNTFYGECISSQDG